MAWPILVGGCFLGDSKTASRLLSHFLALQRGWPPFVVVEAPYFLGNGWPSRGVARGSSNRVGAVVSVVAMGGQNPCRLDWDPWEWRCPPTQGSQGAIPFFAYSARIGKRVLGKLKERAPTRAQSFCAQGILLIFLPKCTNKYDNNKIKYK